jgi:hypothetical protein
VVLAETAGHAAVTGVIDGAPIDVSGPGVLELLHG